MYPFPHCPGRHPRRPSLTHCVVLPLIALCCVLLFGCSEPVGGKADDAESRQASATQEDAPATTSAEQLREGYSLLYANISGLKHVDKAFLIKFENDRVQKTVSSVSDFADALAKELEGWAEASDAVRLDLDPLPEMEKRKLAAVQKDRLLSFAPIVGRTGANWQRTLLLSQSGALNQLRHLTEVIAEAEPNADRGARMLEVSESLDDHYDEVVVLLNDLYFCHDDPEPSVEEGG